MLSLHQKLSLQQKLSPQQIQYQKLLQLNTMALEQRIKTELELNPVLEETLDEEFELTQEQKEDSPDDQTDEYESDSSDEFDVEDFMNDGDLDNDRINKSPDDEDNRPIAPSRISQTERLLDQLHILDLPEEQIILGEVIISSLSKDGYFREDWPGLPRTECRLSAGLQAHGGRYRDGSAGTGRGTAVGWLVRPPGSLSFATFRWGATTRCDRACHWKTARCLAL